MKKILSLCTFTLLLLINITSLRGEEVEDINLVRSRFFIDHAIFADTGSNRLEVYYKIFNDGLNYVKKGDKYVSNYEVNVIVFGDKDKQVTGKSVEKSYLLDSYEKTRSESGYLINQISLPLSPGNYALVCKLIDHNSNDVSTIEAKVDSYHFIHGGDLSDIEFIQEGTTPDETSQFVKGGKSALPTVERALDGEQQNLCYYTEIYAGDHIGENLEIKCVVEGDHHGAEMDTSFTVKIDAAVTGISEKLKVDELSPGEYDLKLLLNSQGKTIAERHGRFLIKWSLASLIKNDFEYAVEQLKYLIKKDEKKALLQEPDSLRLAAFETWWKGKDPTPATPANELREEYYRRIRYSNQYFATVNREGWESDRGMIYIKYGEPDQIDRHPFELGTKPYQIWYYFSQRRTFVFEDSRGDGDYQLQYPFDGDWHRGIGP